MEEENKRDVYYSTAHAYIGLHRLTSALVILFSAF